MNVDRILAVFADRHVDAILIGGMNFILRHEPVLTYDVDFWIRDTDENLARTAGALALLDAQWGRDEKSWGPVLPGIEWLKTQSVFCLTTQEGALDIFREVRGLEGQFDACWSRAIESKTEAGTPFRGLADSDMLACQLALPPKEQNAQRIAYFRSRSTP
jgi:hypothetical protein